MDPTHRLALGTRVYDPLTMRVATIDHVLIDGHALYYVIQFSPCSNGIRRADQIWPIAITAPDPPPN